MGNLSVAGRRGNRRQGLPGRLVQGILVLDHIRFPRSGEELNDESVIPRSSVYDATEKVSAVARIRPGNVLEGIVPAVRIGIQTGIRRAEFIEAVSVFPEVRQPIRVIVENRGLAGIHGSGS